MAVYLNKEFVENEAAKLHVSDLSMQRGYAVFDFFRTVNFKPLFLTDHLDRFFNSASAMGLLVNKPKEELSSIIIELIKRNQMPECGIRLMLTGGYSPDSYQLAEPNLIISCVQVKVITEKEFEKGIQIITFEHQRELPHIKSINYQMAVWLQPELKKQLADDVLYFKNNIITEFPRSNVFIITKDERLVTPSKNILLGITRKNVLALASEIMKVEERDITIDELLNAAEVFLTSTTKKILPVLKINNRVIGDGKPGKFSKQLFQKFISLEKKSTHLVNL